MGLNDGQMNPGIGAIPTKGACIVFSIELAFKLASIRLPTTTTSQDIKGDVTWDRPQVHIEYRIT